MIGRVTPLRCFVLCHRPRYYVTDLYKIIKILQHVARLSRSDIYEQITTIISFWCVDLPQLWLRIQSLMTLIKAKIVMAFLDQCIYELARCVRCFSVSCGQYLSVVIWGGENHQPLTRAIAQPRPKRCEKWTEVLTPNASQKKRFTIVHIANSFNQGEQRNASQETSHLSADAYTLSSQNTFANQYSSLSHLDWHTSFGTGADTNGKKVAKSDASCYRQNHISHPTGEI